jgi:uncharacterized membrane protein YgcG
MALMWRLMRKSLEICGGVGRRETNRGVIVLLAIKDHKWRIEVGRGLEQTISNSKANAIGTMMIPRLRANDFDGAVKIAVREIAKVVTSAQKHSPTASTSHSTPVLRFAPALATFIEVSSSGISSCAVCLRRSTRRPGRCACRASLRAWLRRSTQRIRVCSLG